MADFISSVVEFLVFIFKLTYQWLWGYLKFFLPIREKDISKDIIFITGAGSGLGRGMSIEFAKRGAILVCSDINKNACDQTVNTIKENGGKAHSYALDVSDRFQVYAVADQIRNEVGDVTMLINNAGIVTGKYLLDCPDEKVIKTMEVNSLAHFWTVKAFLRPMIKKNSGHIVTIASIAGYFASPQQSDYIASKHAAVGFHETLEMELMKFADQIKLTCVNPFFIQTGMFAGADKSLCPRLLPELTEEQAVNGIVHGVLREDEYVWLPSKLIFNLYLKAIQPATTLRLMTEYFQLHEQMATFKGRTEKKAQ